MYERNNAGKNIFGCDDGDISIHFAVFSEKENLL